MDKVTYNTTKEDILSIAVPGQTRTWKPVSNERLIDTTLNSIIKSGFTLDSESYSKAQNGMQTNGKYTIRNVADNEMQLQIAWQNSYNKSLSLKFATGINVFICSNGACVGD